VMFLEFSCLRGLGRSGLFAGVSFEKSWCSRKGNGYNLVAFPKQNPKWSSSFIHSFRIFIRTPKKPTQRRSQSSYFY